MRHKFSGRTSVKRCTQSVFQNNWISYKPIKNCTIRNLDLNLLCRFTFAEYSFFFNFFPATNWHLAHSQIKSRYEYQTDHNWIENYKYLTNLPLNRSSLWIIFQKPSLDGKVDETTTRNQMYCLRAWNKCQLSQEIKWNGNQHVY